jgi:hypothetical protein
MLSPDFQGTPGDLQRIRTQFRQEPSFTRSLQEGIRKVVIMGAVKSACDEVGQIFKVRGLNFAPCHQVLLSLYPSG